MSYQDQLHWICLPSLWIYSLGPGPYHRLRKNTSKNHGLWMIGPFPTPHHVCGMHSFPFAVWPCFYHCGIYHGTVRKKNTFKQIQENMIQNAKPNLPQVSGWNIS